MDTSLDKLVMLPFITKSGIEMHRVVVRPTTIPETEHPSGIIRPTISGADICIFGEVVASNPKSTIRPGDFITYRLIDRDAEADKPMVILEGKEYHFIFETEIWSVNDKPLNRLLVETTSAMRVTEDGIYVPDSAEEVPQEGIVRFAPETSKYFKGGERIKYRINQNGIFPETIIDGKRLQILFEADVFTINDVVSPHRMIVKINSTKQRAFQKMHENGMALHPLFNYMKRYLQYARVVEIGTEAAAMYDGKIKVGDYVAINHKVEHQPTRVLSTKRNRHGVLAYELRVLNCFSAKDREVLGAIKTSKTGDIGDLKFESVEPVGDNVFVRWPFKALESFASNKKQVKDESIEDLSFSVSKFSDLEELHAYIDRMKATGFNSYKAKFNSLMGNLQRLDPAKPENQPNIRYYESQIAGLRVTADRSAAYVRSNHLLVCKLMTPTQSATHCVATFKELYPISVMGQKMMVAHPRFILFYLNMENKEKTMLERVVMTGDNVLIQASDPSKDYSGIEVPATVAAERPFRGTVISKGPDVLHKINEGDEVYFKKYSGTEVELDNQKYFVMGQNQVLMVIGN